MEEYWKRGQLNPTCNEKSSISNYGGVEIIQRYIIDHTIKISTINSISNNKKGMINRRYEIRIKQLETSITTDFI